MHRWQAPEKRDRINSQPANTTAVQLTHAEKWPGTNLSADSKKATRMSTRPFARRFMLHIAPCRRVNCRVTAPLHVSSDPV
jgi:hypothetical protein